MRGSAIDVHPIMELGFTVAQKKAVLIKWDWHREEEPRPVTLDDGRQRSVSCPLMTFGSPARFHPDQGPRPQGPARSTVM